MVDSWGEPTATDTLRFKALGAEIGNRRRGEIDLIGRDAPIFLEADEDIKHVVIRLLANEELKIASAERTLTMHDLAHRRMVFRIVRIPVVKEAQILHRDLDGRTAEFRCLTDHRCWLSQLVGVVEPEYSARLEHVSTNLVASRQDQAEDPKSTVGIIRIEANETSSARTRMSRLAPEGLPGPEQLGWQRLGLRCNEKKEATVQQRLTDKMGVLTANGVAPETGDRDRPVEVGSDGPADRFRGDPQIMEQDEPWHLNLQHQA
jgi:hypothetical protein